VNVLLRFGIAASNRHAVDTGRATRSDETTGWTNETIVTGPNQRRMFWTKAVPLYMLEPHVGRSYIAAALPMQSVTRDKATATSRATTFTRDVHPLAVGALRSAAECATDIRTSLLLVGVEDMPELCVELAYLLLSTEPLTIFFLLSTAGTLMSVVRQLYELRFDVRARPRLLRDKAHIDVSFKAESDSAAAVLAWAEEHGKLCRIVDLLKCTWVDARTLERLPRLCPFLDELNLDGCSEIGDDALVPAAPRLRRLHKLKLNGTRVGDGSARAIAEHCVDLRVLFAPKSRITDDGFVAICESCRHLSSISIVSTAAGDRTLQALARCAGRGLNAVYAGTTGITDDGLRALAAGCPNLGLLTCGAGAVTDAGLVALVDKCSKLLMLTANSLFTVEGLMTLVTRCPDLRVVWCSSCNAEKGGRVDAEGWARLDAAAAHDRVFRR
jgi:hypothetical protein